MPPGHIWMGLDSVGGRKSFLASGHLLGGMLPGGTSLSAGGPAGPCAGHGRSISGDGETQDTWTLGPRPSRGGPFAKSAHSAAPGLHPFLDEPPGELSISASLPLMISLPPSLSPFLFLPLLPHSLSCSHLPLNLMNCFFYIFIYL